MPVGVALILLLAFFVVVPIGVAAPEILTELKVINRAPTATGWVINEIFADPALDSSGDANGDGTREASGDEFVEVYNNTGGAVNISGWSLSDDDGDD